MSMHSHAASKFSCTLNQCLPKAYAKVGEREGEAWVQIILQGLREAWALGDMHRGARFHCTSLSRFLLLKYELQDSARRELVEILFSFATLPELPSSHLPTFCVLLATLLRRGKHLTNLHLPWQPLFALLLRLHLPKLRPCAYENRAFARSPRVELVRCAVQCRRHFREGSSVDILRAVEPLLCPHESAEFVLGAGLLSLLLPTRGSEASQWLPRVTDLWLCSGIDGAVEWEAMWLKLLERLAKDEFYGRADPVQWMPLLPTIYSRALLLLSLPGGHESRSELRPSLKRFPFEVISSMASFSASDALRAAARIIVLTLPPVSRVLPQTFSIPGAEPLPLDPPAAELLMGGVVAEQWAELRTEAEAEAEAALLPTEALHYAQTPTRTASYDRTPSAWTALRQLLRCAEPYCHPSNTGSYCHELGSLLQALCRFTYWRVLMEVRGEAAAAASSTLARGDVEALVRLFGPLVAQARYSKHHFFPRMAETCLKYLCRLAPELMFPQLEVRVAEGLQAVTAVHQTSVALTTLSLMIPLQLTMCPISELPIPLCVRGDSPSVGSVLAIANAPAAMRSLLELALPGIDANDPGKMLMTLHVFGCLLQIVPLAGTRWEPAANTSEATEDVKRLLGSTGIFAREALVQRLREEAQREEGGVQMEVDSVVNGPPGTASATEAMLAMESQLAEAEGLSGWLPELATQLLARMLLALEHQEKMPKQHSGQSLLLAQWRMTALLFWQQLSEPLFDKLLPEVLKLLPRSSLSDAAKHLGAHLSAAALARPDRAVSLGMPTFLALLLTPPDDNGGRRSLRALSENELVWLLRLLAHFVRPVGAALLPFVNDLTAILDNASAHEALPVARAAYKLRRRMLQTLLSCYPTDLRSLPPTAWAHPRVRQEHWACWGWLPQRECQSSLPAAIDLVWHLATAAEIAAAEEMIDSVLMRAEALAVKPSSTTAQARDEELLRCLLELRAVAKGAVPFMADALEGSTAASETVQELLCPWDEDDAIKPTVCIPNGHAPGPAPVSIAAVSITPAQPMDVDETPSTLDEEPLPPMPRVAPRCGRVVIGRSARVRFLKVLHDLGTKLECAEATRSMLQLLRVINAALTYRSSSLLGLHRALLGFSRHSTEVRGGGSHKLMPRSLLILKLHGRHSDRLTSTLRHSTLRCPEVTPLLELLKSLSMHRYSLVRKAAQSGYVTVVQDQMWLCRPHLTGVISRLSDPAAQPHECKGAAFLLSCPQILGRVAADWRLLCQLLSALCNAHEHQLPKLHQRLRTLLRDVIKNHNSPPIALARAQLDAPQDIDGLMPPAEPTPALVPGTASFASRESAVKDPSFDVASRRLASHFARATQANESVRRACIDDALGLVKLGSPASTATANGEAVALLIEPRVSAPESEERRTHCSREVSALCALLLLQRPLRSLEGHIIDADAAHLLDLERRHDVAVAAVRGLCSPTAAVRRLSRALLSAMLARPRTGGTRLSRAGKPAALWEEIPADDAVWKRTELDDKLGSGWGCNQYYRKGGKRVGGSADGSFDAHCHVGKAQLGPEADSMLSDEAYLSRALQWFVTDHKEADDTQSSGISSLAEQLQPHDVLCMAFKGGRPWPYTDSHCITGTNFSIANAQLFKGLAANYGHSLVHALLPVTKRLCAASGQRDAQAVAAEVLAGVSRGAGRWPLPLQRRLWDELAGPLGEALRGVSIESISDWQMCLRFIAFNRDPRRQQWLARVLLQQSAASTAAETSLSQANHLRFASTLLIEMGWKGADLAEELLGSEQLQGWITHPYKQVREEVGTTLSVVMHAAAPTPKAEAPGAAPVAALQATVASFFEHVLEKCTVGGQSRVVHQLEPDNEASKTSVRAARETALCCLRHCLKNGRPKSCSNFLPSLLPVVLSTAASPQPPDLANFGKSVAVLLAQAPMDQALYEKLLGAVVDVSRSSSWHLRGCLLPLLKLLVYRGQFMEPRAGYRERLAELLLHLLSDQQQEVREATMPLVSGFVRLHGASARVKVTSWALERTRRGAPLAELHAGVLGLEALVILAPYDVPIWLPELLERLASFANQPQPIKATVTKTFADFRRTHQDNWQQHKQRLTTEQQELLADMHVAPSFYA